ncbi:MAG: hypothetical protein JXR19_09280 [Bacteroidia bacterium]
MKKIVMLICAFAVIIPAKAQQVEKGSYQIAKIDLLNFMGLGIQKLHLAYEFSPIKENPKNLTTLQFDLTAPFNSMDYIDVVGGVEAGVQLRFYKKWNSAQNDVQGLYFGIGMDGGWVSFTKDKDYTLEPTSSVIRTYTHKYDRVRNGIYASIGSQAKLGEKLYFDVQLGMGWSNVNVKEKPIEIEDGYTSFNNWWWGPRSPFYILYEEGKYQQFYMPVSFSIGYNFGSK